MFVCVCVCEREREREQATAKERENMTVCALLYRYAHVCVHVFMLLWTCLLLYRVECVSVFMQRLVSKLPRGDMRHSNRFIVLPRRVLQRHVCQRQVPNASSSSHELGKLVTFGFMTLYRVPQRRWRGECHSLYITHSSFKLSNLSSLHLVSIFRCSSPPSVSFDLRWEPWSPQPCHPGDREPLVRGTGAPKDRDEVNRRDVDG